MAGGQALRNPAGRRPSGTIAGEEPDQPERSAAGDDSRRRSRCPASTAAELSLSDYAGRPVLLVFSDPDCGPCDVLAPQLERSRNETPGVSVVMVSRGDPERNRSKVAAHGLTFPVVLQEQWQLSREYAKFATPIAYLIDDRGTHRAPTLPWVRMRFSLCR